MAESKRVTDIITRRVCGVACRMRSTVVRSADSCRWHSLSRSVGLTVVSVHVSSQSSFVLYLQ